MSEKLQTVRETAEQLGLGEATIRAWILQRRIEVVRVGRRAIRIPSSAIEKIIKAGTIPAHKEQQ